MALVLFIAFGLQTFSRVIIMFDYAVNKKAYAKNCVNKFRPKMHCNGQCQMMKKLQQEEKKDQQNPERKLEHKNELVLFSKSFYPEIELFSLLNKQIYFLVQIGEETKMPHSVFHPPTC